jgi:putative colanic acid biosynthesis acetyltransferase WcaF
MPDTVFSGSSAEWDLSKFSGRNYNKGRPKAIQALWLFAQDIIMQFWIPNKFRILVLKCFGCRIGNNVLIRHRVRIHWPWKLVIGDNTWIGEGAWILNLENVTIGSNVCVSQDVVICSGSHDRKSDTFEFDNKEVIIQDNSWIALRGVVLRGVTIGRGAVVAAGAIATKDVKSGDIFFPGNR